MEEPMTQTQTRDPRLSPEAGRSPDAVAGVQQILKSIYASGVPRHTLELVHMRASQINGCNACIAYGIKSAEETGLSAERMLALPAWRESAAFDDAERAAADHFDEPSLSALVSMAALTNFFNRVNTTLRVQPDAWG
jgi:AhpD family alkylhydroperoxidase